MSLLESSTYEQKKSESNFTQIPNVVFDYWMPRLSLAAQSILFLLFRKTFGHEEKSAIISKNELVKCSGISKNTIQKAIEELVNFDLLVIFKENKENNVNKTNSYSLNIHTNNLKTNSGVTHV